MGRSDWLQHSMARDTEVEGGSIKPPVTSATRAQYPWGLLAVV